MDWMMNLVATFESNDHVLVGNAVSKCNFCSEPFALPYLSVSEELKLRNYLITVSSLTLPRQNYGFPHELTKQLVPSS